jgi:hypothetical protein
MKEIKFRMRSCLIVDLGSFRALKLHCLARDHVMVFIYVVCGKILDQCCKKFAVWI